MTPTKHALFRAWNFQNEGFIAASFSAQLFEGGSYDGSLSQGIVDEGSKIISPSIREESKVKDMLSQNTNCDAVAGSWQN